MPRKFSDQEKVWIRKKLVEAGRQRFSSHGLKKTSLEDLTKAASISQGAFYLFFGSKEELFYEVLLEEESVIRQQLSSYMRDDTLLNREGIRRFIKHAFEMMSENSIVRQILVEGQFELILRKLPVEILERDRLADEDALLPIVRRWQSAGILASSKLEHITGMLRAIMLLSLHKKEIGEAVYDGTIDLIIDLIATGIVMEGKTP